MIAGYAPDVVALQEVDVGRPRSGKVDQPHVIAEELEMHYHFADALQVEEERYGNAVLTRFPMTLVRAAELPTLPGGPPRERRGALWVVVRVAGREIQIGVRYLFGR